MPDGYLNFIKGYNFTTNYDSEEMKTTLVPQNNYWLSLAKTLPYHFIVSLKKIFFFIFCKNSGQSHVITRSTNIFSTLSEICLISS